MIEAKGGTSARAGTARYKLAFNASQVFDRVAKGFYTAACMYVEYRKNGDRVGLAFQDTPPFRNYLKQVKVVTDRLKITVYRYAATACKSPLAGVAYRFGRLDGLTVACINRLIATC